MDHHDELPYVTEGHPPIPAVAKWRYEDFRVEEIPLYEPDGAGEHVVVRIEKRGRTSVRAVHEIARALGVKARDVGIAGLKDARAVTTQFLSIQGVDPDDVRRLDLSGIRVLSVERHHNKLKKGHLAGNRFVIRLRDVGPERLGDVHAVLDALALSGVPNYFGPQRFGHRGDAHLVGAALLAEDWKSAVELLGGRASSLDTGHVLRARQLFDEGEYAQAAKAWPAGFHEASRVTRAMERMNADPAKAVRALDRRSWIFFVSAWQSDYFNRVLAERLRSGLARIDELVPGDLAWKHDSGAVFLVEDPAAEAERLAQFEISPSGPLPGRDLTWSAGAPGALERALIGDVLADEGLCRRAARAGGRGARRPLRFRASEVGAESGSDDLGTFLELRFSLPRGCYATALLREICKQELRTGVWA